MFFFGLLIFLFKGNLSSSLRNQSKHSIYFLTDMTNRMIDKIFNFQKVPSLQSKAVILKSYDIPHHYNFYPIDLRGPIICLFKKIECEKINLTPFFLYKKGFFLGIKCLFQKRCYYLRLVNLTFIY